ncbi:MAG: hypothetical protein EBQ95_01825 [Gammaproteobacteria bacterium]|nr:hypothetical protein [Gammaproteobacteria bacterium]
MAQNNLDTQYAWIAIGEGGYNKTYLSATRIAIPGFFGYLVKKKAKDPYDPMSQIDRIVRKAHEIYPDMPVHMEKLQPYSILLARPPLNQRKITLNVLYIYEAYNKELGVYLYTHEGKKMCFITSAENSIVSPEEKRFLLDVACHRIALTEETTTQIIRIFRLNKNLFYMPYYGSREPSDEDIAQETLDIYCRSRNIIADAGGFQNFKKTPVGARCIDFDCAIRRGSFDSDKFMSSPATQLEFRTYWDDIDRKNTNIKTNALVQTLFYIEKHLPPEQVTNDFLRLEVIDKLHILRRQEHPLTRDDIAIIQEVIDVCPNHHQFNQSFVPEVLAQLRTHRHLPDFNARIEYLLFLNQPITDDVIDSSLSSEAFAQFDETIFSSPEF